MVVGKLVLFRSINKQTIGDSIGGGGLSENATHLVLCSSWKASL